MNSPPSAKHILTHFVDMQNKKVGLDWIRTLRLEHYPWVLSAISLKWLCKAPWSTAEAVNSDGPRVLQQQQAQQRHQLERSQLHPPHGDGRRQSYNRTKSCICRQVHTQPIHQIISWGSLESMAHIYLQKRSLAVIRNSLSKYENETYLPNHGTSFSLSGPTAILVGTP